MKLAAIMAGMRPRPFAPVSQAPVTPPPAPAPAPGQVGDRLTISPAGQSRLGLPRPLGGAPSASPTHELAALLAELQRAVAALEAKVAELETQLGTPAEAPVATPAEAPAVPALSYTTRYAHPVAELAEQLATDAETLMALNGWTDASAAVPAGSAIRVPDTEAVRARVAEYTGATQAVDAPTGVSQPAPEAPASPAGQVGDPMSYFFSQFYNERFNPTGPSRSSNCGPASLAMALKAFGVTPPGLEDRSNVEQYIDKTRRAMTGNEDDHAYTNTSQVVRGAQAAGANAETISGLAGVEAALAEGKLVVAAGNPAAYQGRFSGAEMSKYDGGHFILVAGRDGAGNYLINDPLSRVGTVAVTPDELRGYLGYEGWNVGVAVWR